MRGGREWLLALLLGGAVVLWLGSLIGEGDQQEAESITAADPARYEARGADWTRTDTDGEPVFRVRAERLTMHASERVAIEAPRVRGLGENDSWSLTAPLGEVPADSRSLRLSGGVDIEGEWPDGSALKGQTQELIVALSERELRSEHAVTLQGTGRRMQGVGLLADIDGERLRLLDEVRVRYDDAR
jgi:LPS export ABC transporter protein LptC